VQQVLEGLHARLPIAEGAEVSLEANPSVADAERYAGYRAAGVNRLSLGVQSFQPETLRALGRDHDAAQAEGAFRAARSARFESVSLDFIYGVHGQSLAQVRADATRAAALEPEHLSTYALTVEREELAEDTPLAKRLARGELQLPPDELVVDMAQAVREAYGARGLVRYEVSNHARPGHSSRHNALYWTGGEYLALGVGATGMLHLPGTALAGARYTNLRSPEQYLTAVEAGRLPEASREALSARELFEERFAMGLRLRSGVDWEQLCLAYGEDPAPRRAEVSRLLAHGLATLSGPRLVLTDAGADVHSEVCARLL
jgi:oxygen-independent coproporphyrinogen-3 oxidase